MCYHKAGREKKSWLCPHTHKVHYARGKCRNCYLKFYHKEQLNKKKSKDNSDHNHVESVNFLEKANFSHNHFSSENNIQN